MSFLSVKNLRKNYGNTVALHGIDLQIEKGAIVGLIGPDGAGKTTTMRILCGLIDPDSGTGEFETVNLFGERKGLNARIGYMPQNFSLYPDLTVEENMRFYADLFKVRGDEFRNKRDRLYAFSQLGPFRDRRSGALSGGMKQKLALSCALMRDPDLLILDEPTTGVDPLSRRQFWELLFQLRASGATILVATPYMDEANKADLVLFLAEGVIIARGTPEEISKSFIGSVYELQRQLSNIQIDEINKQSGIRARRFGASVHLTFEPNQTIAMHRNILEQVGIQSEELHQVNPSLEDRFLQLIQQEENP